MLVLLQVVGAGALACITSLSSSGTILSACPSWILLIAFGLFNSASSLFSNCPILPYLTYFSITVICIFAQIRSCSPASVQSTFPSLVNLHRILRESPESFSKFTHQKTLVLLRYKRMSARIEDVFEDGWMTYPNITTQASCRKEPFNFYSSDENERSTPRVLSAMDPCMTFKYES